MAPFRWGLLGAGPVTKNFVLGLRAFGACAQVAVVASRQRGNAERFAKTFGIPSAADYDEAIADPRVDALYIATPTSEHKAHALAGIAAGKAILVEKPFATDAAAAIAIIEAARARGVFCMEGLWTRFQPLIRTVHERLAAGDIGEVRGFRGDFCGASRPDPQRSEFDPARGGGALLHKGVYLVSLARLLLGPIEDVQASARFGQTGVDEDCVLILRHASGALSTLRASNRSSGSNDVLIYGTKGLLHIKSPIVRPPAARITFFAESGGGSPQLGRFERLVESGWGQTLKQRLDPAVRALRSTKGRSVIHRYRGNGFYHEAQAVMDGVANRATESELMPLDETLEVMRILDRARAMFQPEVWK